MINISLFSTSAFKLEIISLFRSIPLALFLLQVVIDLFLSGVLPELLFLLPPLRHGPGEVGSLDKENGEADPLDIEIGEADLVGRVIGENDPVGRVVEENDPVGREVEENVPEHINSMSAVP